MTYDVSANAVLCNSDILIWCRSPTAAYKLRDRLMEGSGFGDHLPDFFKMTFKEKR